MVVQLRKFIFFAHRVFAYTFAGVIAAVAGILMAWQNAQISPGTAGLPAVIDILVIAIVGGLKRPIGPFIGALIYVVLRTFAPDILLALGLEIAVFQDPQLSHGFDHPALLDAGLREEPEPATLDAARLDLGYRNGTIRQNRSQGFCETSNKVTSLLRS